MLATLGPATNSRELVYQLIERGVNGFRLNFSHGSYEERDQQITWIRECSKELQKPVAILQDLQGPKIRLGAFDGTHPVKKDEEWTLVFDQPTDIDAKRVEVQYDLSEKMQSGERLYIFDGKIRTEVTHVTSREVTIRILNDGVIMQKKGINVPDTNFGGDILTPKDLRDIDYGAGQDIDYVALSFVQSAEDITTLRQLLVEKGSTAQIIAKVETKAAIEDIELKKIVEQSDGVMVARGDLAVEVSPEVVPVIQRKIISLCQEYGKLSIVATQMMASMVDAPEPTRAEVSDVATAVISGADCVMLSDETANGSYPLETVTHMKKVIMYTQEALPVDVTKSHDESTKQTAISAAAVSLAGHIHATAIVAETKSGNTAVSIASQRPAMPIISVTSNPRVSQQLALMYANKSFCRPDGEKAGWELAKNLRESGYLSEGDTIVLVSGKQPGLIGGTDTIRVRVLN